MTFDRKAYMREYNVLYRETNRVKLQKKSNEYGKEYRQKNREIINLKARIKRQENPELVRQNAREYREQNKERMNKHRKEWYNKNLVKVIGYSRKYGETHREKRRDWRLKNKEIIVKKYKEFYNSEKGTLWALRKRLTKYGMETHSNLKVGDITKIKQKYPICVYCGSKKNLTLEHIMPIRKHGNHNRENIVIACKYCNSSKNDLLLNEWLNTLYCKEKGITKETINPILMEKQTRLIQNVIC